MRLPIDSQITRLEALVQLLRRQTQEWKASATAESNAHLLLRSQQDQAIETGFLPPLEKALMALANADAHVRLSMEYSLERARMMLRHQEEEAELEARFRADE